MALGEVPVSFERFNSVAALVAGIHGFERAGTAAGSILPAAINISLHSASDGTEGPPTRRFHDLNQSCATGSRTTIDGRWYGCGVSERGGGVALRTGSKLIVTVGMLVAS